MSGHTLNLASFCNVNFVDYEQHRVFKLVQLWHTQLQVSQVVRGWRAVKTTGHFVQCCCWWQAQNVFFQQSAVDSRTGSVQQEAEDNQLLWTMSLIQTNSTNSPQLLLCEILSPAPAADQMSTCARNCDMNFCQSVTSESCMHHDHVYTLLPCHRCRERVPIFITKDNVRLSTGTNSCSQSDTEYINRPTAWTVHNCNHCAVSCTPFVQPASHHSLLTSSVPSDRCRRCVAST